MEATGRKIRTLFAVVTLAGVSGAGCYIESNRDDDRAFQVDWIVQTDQGAATTCQGVGATTVDLDLLLLDTRPATEYHDTFPCSAGSGTSRQLPTGEYSIALRLKNAKNEILSEYAFPSTSFITRNGFTDLGVVAFQAYPAESFFQVEWSIVKDATGAALTCPQANGHTVELVTQLAGQQPLVYEFPCGDGIGRTTAVTPGTYTVTVQLIDGSDKVISATDPMAVTVQAATPSLLPKVTFGVN